MESATNCLSHWQRADTAWIQHEYAGRKGDPHPQWDIVDELATQHSAQFKIYEVSLKFST